MIEPNWEEEARNHMYRNYAFACRVCGNAMLDYCAETDPENAARLMSYYNDCVRETFGVDPHWMDV